MKHTRQSGWMNGSRACSVAAVAIVALSSAAVQAQVLYGSLTGNVTDSSGASVPNAAVRATNTATGVSRDTTTNGAGLYSFTDLNSGTYKVDVTATGFAPIEQNNITVLTNTTGRVNVQLQVGGANEQVSVSAAPPLLQADRADTSYNLNPQQVAELPTTSTTGRNFQSLYKLVPGSTPPAEQNSAGGNPQRAQSVNVNGVSNSTNTTRIDGAVDAYPWLAYLVAYLPPTDGIESINVVTGSFNAEQGAAGGSAINVTIKSGTNQFHGSAWEYNTIAQYNAQPWNNRTGVRQKNIYNEFGGSIGGPIIKDKLFFFGDYDRVSVNKAISGTLSVPTAAMRAGNFAGSGTTVYDPATGTTTGAGKAAFANNSIPTARFSPAAVKLLAGLPLPNTGAAGATVNNYFGSSVNAFERSNIDTKITYVPTQNTSIFGHYSISPNNISDPQVFGTNPGGGTYDGGQPGAATGLVQNVGLGATHVITSNFLLDANFGFTRQRLGAQAPDLALGDYGTSVLGIPGTNNNGNALYGGLPGFYFTTYASLGNANTGSPFTFRDNQYTGNVNATYVKHSHSFRFGGEYIHAAINHIQPGSGTQTTPRGSFVFSGGVTTPTGGSSTNINSFADFLLGQAFTYTKGVQSFNPETLRTSEFSFFAQDTWQITRDLTLNYGARYEYYPLPVADHFGTVRFDPSVRSTVTDSTGTHTVGTVLIGGRGSNGQHVNTENHWGMVVPRFGASYRVHPDTVVRGGFGLTVDPDSLRGLLQAYPASVATNVSGSNSYVAATSLNPGLASTTTQVGIPALALPNISSGSLALPYTLSTVTIPQNFRRGYIYSYNAAVQQQLPAQFVANIAWVGTHAVRQQSSVNINAAAPGGGNAGRLLNTTYGANTNITDINALMPFGSSSYNGLQTQLTRTSATHGSTGLIYTWSKAIDVSDNSQYSGLTFAYPTYYARNRALAGYDRQHNIQWYTIYNLPFGKGQSFVNSGVAGHILGGFRLSTVISRVSGSPITVNAAGSSLNAPGSTQVADRVYGLPQVLRSNIGGARQYLNPAAFASVSAVRFGNAGRNSVRGPGIFNLDVSIKRDFALYENLKLELAGDAFDITNTPQFANPASNISNAGFGTITTSNVNRTLRVSGRINF